MNALLDRQREFAAALTGSLYTIAERVIGDAIPAEGRVQVYANHFRVSLLETLAATFPVTRALVGEAFFAQTARAFLIFEPPRSPVLAQYGGGFPTFLAALPDLGGHNYLPDVAAFEWALNVAWHAEDAVLLRPEDLADPDTVGQAAFRLHPAAQRLSTPFPITKIWQVHQPDAEPVDHIVLADGGERLLIWRQDTEVCWRQLTTGEDQFLAHLAAGDPLGDAAMRATEAETGFDFADSFTWMLDGGIFVQPDAP
ncbi:DNA-binding domain-containing protein [Ferrovibrio sp.]|uniref:HvfC/BufC N-terminal domain-containing protein n=1 Tax=Ferrovibrio sp. TaxID=1917215 RepID=UPI00311D66A4